MEGDYEPHHGHGTETTKINLNRRSGGEKCWKPAEIAFDLWPLSSRAGQGLQLSSQRPLSSCP